MGILETVKRHKEKQGATKPADPIRPYTTATEVFKHSCGHVGEFKFVPEEKPEWRANRLKKFQGKKCQECSAKAQEERLEAEKAAKAAKPPRKPKAFKPRVCSVCQERSATHRLPHGAKYFASYDAEKQIWTGCLSLDEREFRGENSSLFKLLRILDDQLWEAWQAAKK